MKHINVALFIPDEGCPHRCSFCNQKTISGFSKKPNQSDVEEAVETALSSGRETSDGEIAFFGGSFTAIERSYMISLLEKAKEYIDKGLFRGIRISTRPDCITEEILCILKAYGVTSIELGCQSMDDEVLLLNNRGHSSKEIIEACNLIKDYGFELGVQMMTGLYGDTDEKAIETAKKLIALYPDTARIYPTIVLENTELARLYKAGIYKPQTLSQAVNLCSRLLLLFHENNIKVIRLGLHSGGNVEDGYLAGAYHPAFRELCESRIYLEKMLELLNDMPKGEYAFTVSKKYISQALGQKKQNVELLKEKGYNISFTTDESLNQYEIKLQGSTR